MSASNRREFLGEVGKGMIIASVGAGLATEMGISPAMAEGSERPVDFGALEPLVAKMQETPPDALQQELVKHMKSGTDLKQLVVAGALANARTFGGEDYIGFHSFMAMVPAYHMSKELPKDRSALPVLKVIYRSSKQIQAKGGRSNEVLHDEPSPEMPLKGELFRSMRAIDLDRSERLLAGLVGESPKLGFNELMPLVQDSPEVHRVVLLYRAWDILGLMGMQHAHTTLRQSLRYCLDVEKRMVQNRYAPQASKTVLPKIIDQYGLDSAKFGERRGDDAWLGSTASTLVGQTPTQAAETMAALVKDGFSLDSLGEVLTTASNLLVLRDKGRDRAFPGKPIGSVHGDSVGVHASDSMNAWWNMAKVSTQRNAVTGLVVGAYHLSQGVYGLGTDMYPYAEHQESVKTVDRTNLLRETEAAIRENNQARAAALAHRYGQLDMPVRPMLDLLLKFAVSEDGSLHAEKYYRTASEEFSRARPAYRWRHITALARVTASEFGARAEGYEDACKLLGQNA